MFLQYLPKATLAAFRYDRWSGMLFGLYAGMSAPFFAVVARRDLHATPFEISLLISAPFLGHLLCMFVACHMQNRPKLPYVLWSGGISRALLFFLAFATHSLMFIGVVVVSQIISCLSSPAYATIMKVAYPDDCRGRLMGLVRVGATFSAMIAGVVGGYLLEKGLPYLTGPISYRIELIAE